MDLSKLKEQETGWNVFQGHGMMKLEDAINVLKNNYDNSSLLQSVEDRSQERAKNIFAQNGLEVDEHPDEFDELRYYIEEHARWNWGAVMPGPVFFRDPKEFEIFSETYDVEESQYEKFKVYAIRNGFNEIDSKEVYSNAGFGGMAGAGVIGYMNDALNGKVYGSSILYIRDSANGFGSFVIKGKKSISDTPENLADLIDYGRYSLGEIYGTTDWEYG